MSDKKLSHIDPEGKAAMVSVVDKAITYREACAEAIIQLGAEIIAELQSNEIQTKKGPVFQTAIIAGTMAVKKTSELIPLCHPLAIEKCSFEHQIMDEEHIRLNCRVGISGRTGVEMEALTGVSIAALTVYDMCKAMSHLIEIKSIRLLSKKGGKTNFAR